MLTIKSGEYESLRRHGEETYPFECCGALLGRFENGGRVVEELAAAELIHARHPYTRGLLECLPALSHRQGRLPVMQRDPSWLET